MKHTIFLIILFHYFNKTTAQNDSLYNRYTPKFRLESAAFIGTLVNLSDLSSKSIVNLELTTSLNKNLFILSFLDIEGKNNYINTTDLGSADKTDYSITTISYGRAIVLSPKWRWHISAGLGQVSYKKERKTVTQDPGGFFSNPYERVTILKLENEKSSNLRANSTLFYDLNNLFAVGLTTGYNINGLKNIGELGLSLALKPRTATQITDHKEKRKIQITKLGEDLKAKQQSDPNNKGLRFYSYEVGFAYSNTTLTKKALKTSTVGEVEVQLSDLSLSTGLYGAYQNTIFGVNASSSVKINILGSRQPYYRQWSMLGGQVVKLSKDVSAEALTGISFYTLAAQKMNNERVDRKRVALPLRGSIVFSETRHKLILNSSVYLSTVATTIDIGFLYAYRL